MVREGPLAGIRVAVTRARSQADDLAQPLRRAGADVLIAPLIRITPMIDSENVRAAVRETGKYDWVVFSSANGVELFIEALRLEGVTVGSLGALRVACVGPATAAAAERNGIRTDVIPEEFVGDAIADALAQYGSMSGSRILLARAQGGRAVLPRLLAEQGAHVTDMELYRSDPDHEGAALLRERMSADLVDVVTFTSGSTARYFARLVGDPGRAVVAVIGPATAEVVASLGMRVLVEADPHTSEGLVDGIIRYVAESRHRGG